MIAVYCFSGAGHSDSLAKWSAELINAPVYQIRPGAFCKTDTAVIVFPVYCQNIPPPVKEFLKTASAKYVILLATYGGISPGNVLKEAAEYVSGTVIAAAAVPTGHSILSESAIADYSPLIPVCSRVYHPQKAEVPRLFKNPFSDFFPAWRSRMGVALRRTQGCNNCKTCETGCPMQALHNGRPGNRCIRCLRCVSLCPQNALRFSVRPLTKGYLHKKRTNKWYMFL